MPEYGLFEDMHTMLVLWALLGNGFHGANQLDVDRYPPRGDTMLIGPLTYGARA